MKKIFTVFLGVAVAACSNTLTYNQAMEKNQANLETSDLKSDAQFLVEAKSLSILAEELGKMAVTLGYAAEIQSYAEKIAEDHKKINEKIDDLASDHKIKVPVEMSGSHQMQLDEVRRSSREEFDEEFLDAIEDLYRSHIDLYESFATDGSINDLRMFAAEYLNILRSNEERADEIEDDLL